MVSDIQPRAALIELTDIRKQYGGRDGAPAVEVLHGISLSIQAGEFVAIVGASGSGKSTLMHILGCLDRPTSGSYRFLGRDVAQMSGDELAGLRREAFGFVFQGYHLIPTLDVLHNVQMPAIYAGMPAQARAERATGLLTRLGLADKTTYRPQQLSGGQQQRLSIARALMNGGQLILADEPTGALDSRSGAQVMALLNELSDAGHTVILITHDDKVAAQARRIVRISDGEIVEDRGQPGRQYSPPATLEAPRNRIPNQFDQADSPSRVSFDRLDIDSAPSSVSWLQDIGTLLSGAWRALWVSRFRTFLTLLSFVIGVTSVIVLVAVGQGNNEKLLQQIALWGTHRMYVRPDVDAATGMRGEFYERDAKVLAQVANVRVAMPYLSESALLRAGGETFATEVWSVTSDAPVVLNWNIRHGVFFTPEDDETLAPVIVLGKVARERLFPDTPAQEVIGQYLLLNNTPLRVVGELEEKGLISGSSHDDELVLIPYSTASQRIFGRPQLSFVSVVVNDLDVLDQTVADIEQVLRETRRANDFRVSNSAAVVQGQKEVLRQQTLLLALIAGISLVVGGLGVMNIMLMSVKERTREIGIRMATGARQRDIRRQFLSEAVVVSFTGGVAGVVIGLAIGALLMLWGVPVIFSVRAMLVAFFCALATGVVFGIMPARQAAKLDPVVALAGE
ncbi:ATP-binding cassette domain-containing protein [Alcaligenes sp. SORT26]|uniref:ABC transporter permease n=1 Tax=Alcaligenes sp. SORT26 TaxID=2813780 RepID=UPI001A9D4126|nr:ABC transporter permease [Alcaligenes sp. SORT26]QTC00905.1 ATP-binding cassette domain-containing protein [Alcaligenes sp. SORT26]